MGFYTNPLYTLTCRMYSVATQMWLKVIRACKKCSTSLFSSYNKEWHSFSKQAPNSYYKPRWSIPTWRAKPILGLTLIGKATYGILYYYVTKIIVIVHNYACINVYRAIAKGRAVDTNTEDVVYLEGEEGMSHGQTTAMAQPTPFNNT